MNALIPMSELNQMAQVLGKNKLFNKTAEELLPLMLVAQAEGRHPAIVVQEFDIIQGRPALNSRAALSRFQSAGGSIAWIERSDNRCTAEFTHSQGGTVRISWDMERAKAAQLVGKDNWKKYPTQMLSARVIAEGVRACFPACLSGFYTEEEVRDELGNQKKTPKEITAPPTQIFPEVIDVTPAPEPVIDTKAMQEEALTLLVQLSELTGQDVDSIMSRITKGKVTTLKNQTEKVLGRIIDILREEIMNAMPVDDPNTFTLGADE